MAESTNRDIVTSPLTTNCQPARSIEEARTRFESTLTQVYPPNIEAALDQHQTLDRTALLRELVRTEVSHRRALGERPEPSDYAGRFPREIGTLLAAFADADATEPLPAPVDAEQPLVCEVRYSQLRFHAAGGLGKVFRARDEGLKRDVALKFIQARHLPDAECRERFFQEAEITGRLDHPGVCPVFAFGQTADDRLFYAMRFIEGVTMRQAIDDYHDRDWRRVDPAEKRLALRQLLTHFVAVCNTLAYAHNRGVVHRDIKPENVMIGPFRETLVVDWGFALSVPRSDVFKQAGLPSLRPGKLLDSSSVTGAGTIGYMSPEAVSGDSEIPGPASDIYSLGATLYKLLTGRTAIQGPASEETWQKIRHGSYPAPQAVNAEVPPALAAVCLKAMALRPADRYSTSLELAADVQNWMGDEAVSVYREPRLERMLRSARRHRSWSASLGMAVAAILLVSLVASGVFFSMKRQADAARDQTLRQSAMFAALTMQGNVDRLWLTLGQRAAEPQLRSLVLAAQKAQEGSEAWKTLQGWLDSAVVADGGASRTDLWYIVGRDGTMLALTACPGGNKVNRKSVIGHNFAHRDYFHGKGYDLDKDEEVVLAEGFPLDCEHAQAPTLLEPLEHEGLSSCFRATGTDSYMIAASVPIWSEAGSTDGKPVAVLCASINLGELKILEDAILVDTETVRLAAGSNRPPQPVRGLILQHPRLSPTLAAASEDPEELPKLTGAQIEQLKGSISAATRRHKRSPQLGALIRDFEDPLEPGVRKVAAVASVTIRTPGSDPIPRGLLVIVPETAALNRH